MPDPDPRPVPPAAPPREDVDDLILNKVLFLRIIHSFTLHLAVSCI